MKKVITLMLALAMCVMFFGCSKEIQFTDDTNANVEEQEQKEATKKAMLYVNMETGSEMPEYQEYPFEYSGDLSAEMLAGGLSELMGLDFSITASKTADGLMVDWADQSTLIAGLGEREQKEEFLVCDVDSLRWLMLDSLWITLTENLGVENIYYSMYGGSELWFDELYPVDSFALDIPYMGSAFYYNAIDIDAIDEIEEGDVFIPLFVAKGTMLSDPPEGQFSYDEAYDVLAQKVLAYEQIEIPDEMNLAFVYQGIMEYDDMEYYNYLLCENFNGDFDAAGVEVLYAYLVDGQGNVLKDMEYVWEPVW